MYMDLRAVTARAGPQPGLLLQALLSAWSPEQPLHRRTLLLQRRAHTLRALPQAVPAPLLLTLRVSPQALLILLLRTMLVLLLLPREPPLLLRLLLLFTQLMRWALFIPRCLPVVSRRMSAARPITFAATHGSSRLTARMESTTV